MEEQGTPQRPRLTSLSHGSGCGCKIAPLELKRILAEVETKDFPNVLVGNKQGDDAAVIDIGNDQAVVSTTDFFMPIVDDAFTFGQIAATNAISDVFAMGGRPISALAILGWPIEQLGAEEANRVMKGAVAVCDAHQIPLAGGHSVESKEPFFGLAVNGLINHSNIKTNIGAQPGDLILLTKPIGTGMLAAALKRDLITDEERSVLLDSMITSNAIGSQLGDLSGVRAMTDVTGFGLIGHLLEMCGNNELSAELHFEDVPMLSESSLKKYSSQFVVPNNTMRNFKAYHDRCSKMDALQLHTLCDPQTSGGLLVAVSPDTLDQVKSIFEKSGIKAAQIGHFDAWRVGLPIVRIT